MEVSLLKDIVVIFALSTIVNLVFTRLNIPTVVGYLLTGIISGPHLLSLIKGQHEIELMAEIGVILLLFTIGMEFSLKHLVRIRRIVFLGGLLQVTFTAGAFYLATRFYDLSWQSGLFIGFLSALSSSALVLKILQERSELTSNYGRTVLGILIFQDILLVPLLLFTNMLGSHGTSDVSGELLTLLGKTVLIISFVYVSNKWLLPKLLHLIALARNQELFMMSIFVICLGIALLTSVLGMSLAFGAFLAGLMISESEYSHNAFGNLVVFKDTFTSFFFVSIGMLLDISFILDNYQLVIVSVLLVIVIKTIIAGGTGFILGHTFRGTVIVGLALCQVGEFSFILAKLGFQLNIINSFYYQLFLAVAVITMGLTPFLMKLSRPLADMILRLPLPEFLVKGLFPLKEIDIPDMRNHMVIIGKDASALKLSVMATYNKIQHVSIIFDPTIAREKMQQGDAVIYGDATNEPILHKAHVDKADIIVISVGELIPAMSVIEQVRSLNKRGYILVRAKYSKNLEQLYKLGADLVLAEKLEIAIDIFNRILTKMMYPQKDINHILMRMRNINLGDLTQKDKHNQLTIFDELPTVNICARIIEEGSFAAGKTLNDIKLRKKTGVTLIAIKRNEELIEHPGPKTVLRENDTVYIFGNAKQVIVATEMFSKEEETKKPESTSGPS